MIGADGLYLCEVCGKESTPDTAKHTFLAAQYMGHRYKTPALILDFCSRAHAQYYWQGSWFYARMFSALNIRVNSRGVWYVAR